MKNAKSSMQGIRLPRRGFFQVMGASAVCPAGEGTDDGRLFQLVEVAHAAAPPGVSPKFSFACISHTHLYSPKINDQFIRAALKAVDDVNRLDPQPDFVLFGGDWRNSDKKKNWTSAARF